MASERRQTGTNGSGASPSGVSDCPGAQAAVDTEGAPEGPGSALAGLRVRLALRAAARRVNWTSRLR